MNYDQVILHHYPQSPVTEKVRVVLGLKGLTWKSVEIPRLPPKPNLMPLTGGYRLTPVMQIGADIYCDSTCIIRELERRFPEPTLFPGGAHGLPWALGQWTDGPLIQDVVCVALVEMSANMPPEFLADRGPLYFGPDFSLDDLKARYGECLANVRTQFGWIDERLGARSARCLGVLPGLVPARPHGGRAGIPWPVQEPRGLGATGQAHWPWRTRRYERPGRPGRGMRGHAANAGTIRSRRSHEIDGW